MHCSMLLLIKLDLDSLRIHKLVVDAAHYRDTGQRAQIVSFCAAVQQFVLPQTHRFG